MMKLFNGIKHRLFGAHKLYINAKNAKGRNTSENEIKDEPSLAREHEQRSRLNGASTENRADQRFLFIILLTLFVQNVP